MYDIVLPVGAIVLALVGAVSPATDVMTNSWLVKLHGAPGVSVARSVAARNGFSYVSPVSTTEYLGLWCKQVNI